MKAGESNSSKAAKGGTLGATAAGPKGTFHERSQSNSSSGTSNMNSDSISSIPAPEPALDSELEELIKQDIFMALKGLQFGEVYVAEINPRSVFKCRGIATKGSSSDSYSRTRKPR